MTKIISISDNAYELLEKLKGEGESFTKVILRVAEKEKPKLSSFFGALSKESADALEREIKKSRALHRKLHQKRLKKLFGFAKENKITQEEFMETRRLLDSKRF